MDFENKISSSEDKFDSKPLRNEIEMYNIVKE